MGIPVAKMSDETRRWLADRAALVNGRRTTRGLAANLWGVALDWVQDGNPPRATDKTILGVITDGRVIGPLSYLFLRAGTNEAMPALTAYTHGTLLGLPTKFRTDLRVRFGAVAIRTITSDRRTGPSWLRGGTTVPVLRPRAVMVATPLSILLQITSFIWPETKLHAAMMYRYLFMWSESQVKSREWRV